MRRTTFIVLSVGLLAATVGLTAQKGKPGPAPKYVWSVSIDPASLNVEGPGGWLVSNDVTVMASASGQCATCPTSNFELTVLGPSNIDDQPWLGFKDLVAIEAGLNSPCRYPAFDGNGLVRADTPYAEPSASCVIDFLSHKHPQLPYRHVRVWISILNFDIMAMPSPSAQTPVTGRLSPQIAGPDCTTVNNYSAVAFTSAASTGTMWVTRVSADEWKVDLVNHPIGVSEWVQFRTTTRKGGTSCGTEILRPSATSQVTATLTWRRTLVQ
jgi:hypothetical protein